ncbi:hypothetical protein DVF53_23530 [Salmonella enterica subsp. enterica serovar Kottbus]|nr:hypothetical protein [Salmonella enterica subsp. enterica serovar Kottbus]EHN5888508.1 hypothetical protein [Salmonella enterica subsp. enterica serovar Newport]
MTENKKHAGAGSPQQEGGNCRGLTDGREQFSEATGTDAGCFTRDTLVSTAEGTTPLGGLYRLNKRPDVVTRDGSVSASGGVDTGGIQEIFGLLTDCAYIKGTASHGVLRIMPDCTSEMTALTDLRKGDVVVYRTGAFGSEVPEHEGEPLDISDALELGRHISNMSLDSVQVSDLYYGDKFHSKSGYFSVSIFNVLDKFSNFVYRVPEKLLQAPEAFIAAYLRGYFDGGVRFHLNRITATVACRELASDIVYLLSLFGINGKIIKKIMGFEVVVTGTSDIERFISKIGFINQHDFSGSRAEPAVTGIDYEKLRDEYRRKSSGLSAAPSLPDTVDTLIRELDVWKDRFIQAGLENRLTTLALLSQTGCRTAEVTEYAKYTGRDEVFGVINVEKNHTWCANGVVVSDVMRSDCPADSNPEQE